MIVNMKRTLSHYTSVVGLILGISIFPTLGTATTLTTWNIEWLTLTPSSKLKSSYRDSDDFAALRSHFTAISPTVLAFQEVDSTDAIEEVVGSNYTIYLSDRSLPVNRHHQFGEINQYTGFAVRNDVKVVNVADFPLTKGNRLRFASAIKLKVNGEMINLLSLHLKAGCSGKFTNQNSCHTLKKQGKVLNSWLHQIESQNEAYVLLGDFNHNLAYRDDWLWKVITKNLNTVPRLSSQHTQADCKVRSRNNPSKTHQFRSLIDHIVVSPELRTSPAQQDTMPVKDVLNYQMSDHCPLSIELY